jgi:hypothetical protein
VKWLQRASRLVTEADALISHTGAVLPVSRFQRARLSDYVGQDSALIYGPKNGKNNPRFFAGHAELDGEDGDAASCSDFAT